MTKDELAVRLIDKHDDLRTYVNDTYQKAQLDNIKQQRSLITQLITISSAIIGFTIPVLGSSPLVQTKWLLVCGLSVLLVLIIFGFWYLKHIIQAENKGLESMFKKYSDALDKKHSAELRFISDMSKENYDSWRNEMGKVLEDLSNTLPKAEPDYAIDITFILFTFALALIVFSVVVRL